MSHHRDIPSGYFQAIAAQKSEDQTDPAAIEQRLAASTVWAS